MVPVSNECCSSTAVASTARSDTTTVLDRLTSSPVCGIIATPFSSMVALFCRPQFQAADSVLGDDADLEAVTTNRDADAAVNRWESVDADGVMGESVRERVWEDEPDHTSSPLVLVLLGVFFAP